MDLMCMRENFACKKTACYNILGFAKNCTRVKKNFQIFKADNFYCIFFSIEMKNVCDKYLENRGTVETWVGEIVNRRRI